MSRISLAGVLSNVRISGVLFSLCGYALLAILGVSSFVSEVGADEAANDVAALPSVYQDGPGKNRERTGSSVVERIDPFSGKLNLQYVDAFLPGPAGMDIKVMRTYTNLDDYKGFGEITPLGLGWKMHFGRGIRTYLSSFCYWGLAPTKAPSFELPDGSRQVFYESKNGPYFVSANNWKIDCSGAVPVVLAPDGMRYELGYSDIFYQGIAGTSAWYVTRMVDKNGNWIKFQYENSGYRIKKIEASDGRLVEFNYRALMPSNFLVLDTMVVKSAEGWRTVSYEYEQVPNHIPAIFYMKSAVIPDVGRWEYEYHEYIPPVEFPYVEPPGTNRNGTYSLKKTTSPWGEVIYYDYTNVDMAQTPQPFPLDPVTVVKKKGFGSFYTNGSIDWSQQLIDAGYLTGDVMTGLGPTEYQYFPATLTYHPDAAGVVVPEMLDRTIVIGPEGETHYSHFGYSSASNGYVYAIGVLMDKKVYGPATSAGESLDTRLQEHQAYSYEPRVFSLQTNMRPPSNPVYDDDVAAPQMIQKGEWRGGNASYINFTEFDDFGNPGRIEEIGSDGNNPTARVTTLSYLNDTSKWILSLPQTETMEGVGTVARQYNAERNVIEENRYGVVTAFAYHLHPGGTDEVFGAWGDLAWRKDANLKTSFYNNYKAGIPQTENLPENVTITRVVDDRGNITSEDDGKNPPTIYAYDLADRITSITPPIGTPIGIDWYFTDGYFFRKVTRGAASELTQFDIRNRPFRVTNTDSTTGKSVTQYSAYDAAGRRYFVSYPEFVPAPASRKGVGFEYDALGRISKVKHQYDLATQASEEYKEILDRPPYKQIKNERGIYTTYRYRIFGEAINKELVEIISPEPDASMTISRNGLGQPTSITQDGFTRTFTYDTKYFLLSSIDPEIGQVDYGRDNVGNMTSKRVGTGGPTTLFAYDDLYRLKTVDYPSGTDDIKRTYYKNGQLESVSNTATKRSYFYDLNGNPDYETLQIGAKNFCIDYIYNGSDALSSISYGCDAGARSVSYNPDAWGRATKAMPYLTGSTRHPAGQIASMVYANGVTTTVGLDNRKRPASFKFAAPSQVILDTTYRYDGVGNVEQINDTVDSSFNRSLQYDAIDRLWVAQGSWGYGLFDYDGRGNILGQLYGFANLDYHYDSITNRLTSITGLTNMNFSYDRYGNVTANGKTTFNYNDASNMVCANCGTPEQINYTYDGSGIRVKAQDSLGTTYFIYGQGGTLLWEEPPTGRKKEYVYLDGKQVAVHEQ